MTDMGNPMSDETWLAHYVSAFVRVTQGRPGWTMELAADCCEAMATEALFGRGLGRSLEDQAKLDVARLEAAIE